MRAVSPRSSALHYGWIILGAGTFGSFMTLPGQTAGVSVFFDPITADLGISRTSASIAYAVGTLAGILPAPVIGRWIDRRGPRVTATIIAGGLALACAFMAAVQSATMLLVGFACACFGRSALRHRWRYWVRLHIAGMGMSYILMLVAFYVDNGKQLPLWKDLPHFMYWLIPMAVGIPLIVRALLWPPLARGRRAGGFH